MFSGLIPGNSWGYLVITLLLLGGCGHKGPLRLPAPQPQTAQAPTAGQQINGQQTPEAPSSQAVKPP